MSAVDLTKCQPGDLVRLRDGEQAVYLRKIIDIKNAHLIASDADGEYTVNPGGYCFSKDDNSMADVVAIVHPTRAELEEQRRELLELIVRAVRTRIDNNWLNDARSAIARAGATHG